MDEREHRRLTHAELDRAVRSLRSVGGLYVPLAEYVERDNRPHCIGERTLT